MNDKFKVAFTYIFEAAVLAALFAAIYGAVVVYAAFAGII